MCREVGDCLMTLHTISKGKGGWINKYIQN